MVEDRTKIHRAIEARMNYAIARTLVEVQLSNMGREMLKRSGLKGPALAEEAKRAPRSGWVATTHVFGIDEFGCIRRVELRFRKTDEDGEVRTMSRMLKAGPDGKVHEEGV